MTQQTSLQHRVFDALEITSSEDKEGRLLGGFLMLLIALNVVAAVAQTVPSLYADYGPLFDGFEEASVAIFVIEYLLRLWVAPVNPAFSAQRWPVLAYAMSPLALIDLIAIVPSLLGADLRMLRVFRLLRILRVFKLTRYSNAFSLLGRVLLRTKEELIITVFVLLLMLVVASGLMYSAESLAQPDKFGSIPESMWWGVATLTTVGYGDIYPITPIGKILASIMAIIGIGLFALPTGIISSAFMAEITKPDSPTTCPHCGEAL